MLRSFLHAVCKFILIRKVSFFTSWNFPLEAICSGIRDDKMETISYSLSSSDFNWEMWRYSLVFVSCMLHIIFCVPFVLTCNKNSSSHFFTPDFGSHIPSSWRHFVPDTERCKSKEKPKLRCKKRERERENWVFTKWYYNSNTAQHGMTTENEKLPQ